MVFHDETVDLKTTGTGRVSELNLDELQAVDVLVEPREKIQTLEVLFKEFRSDERRWIPDLKITGIRDRLLRLMGDQIPKEHVVLFGE